MHNPVGFAIIGAGYIAQAHAAALSTLTGASLRAVHSIVAEEARALAGKHGARWSTAIRDEGSPAIDGRDACKSLALVETIYEAARSGVTVPWRCRQADGNTLLERTADQ